MTNGQVTDAPEETIGMTKARRWSLIAYVVFAVIAVALLDRRIGVALLALAWVIHAEAARIRAAVARVLPRNP